jgi:hypothetical protein
MAANKNRDRVNAIMIITFFGDRSLGNNYGIPTI